MQTFFVPTALAQSETEFLEFTRQEDDIWGEPAYETECIPKLWSLPSLDYCYETSGIRIAGPADLSGVAYDTDLFVTHRTHLSKWSGPGWVDPDWTFVVTTPNGVEYGRTTVHIDSVGEWVMTASGNMTVPRATTYEDVYGTEGISTGMGDSDTAFAHQIDVMCEDTGIWTVEVFLNGGPMAELSHQFEVLAGPAPDYAGDPALLPECGCICEVTEGEPLILQPGVLNLDLLDLAFVNNASNKECDFTWEAKLAKGLGEPINFPYLPADGVLTIPEGADPVPIPMPLGVSASTNAKHEGMVILTVKDEDGRSCEPGSKRGKKGVRREIPVCLVPQREEVQWLDTVDTNGWSCWKDPRTNNCLAHRPEAAAAIYAGKLYPGEADFGGREIREQLTNSQDQCASAMQLVAQSTKGVYPSCGKFGTGQEASWIVGRDAQTGQETALPGSVWQRDNVGVNPECTEQYVNFGWACHGSNALLASTYQDMEIKCFGTAGQPEEWVVYSIGELTYSSNFDVADPSDIWVWASRQQGEDSAVSADLIHLP